MCAHVFVQPCVTLVPKSPPCRAAFMCLLSDAHFAGESKLSFKKRARQHNLWIFSTLFIFNIKKTNPKKESLGQFKLSGWQGFCATAFSVSFELSAGAHGPFAVHCSEPEPRVGAVSSVQHQGLTEQWGEMGRGCDSGWCWNGQLESLGLGLLLLGRNLNISSQPFCGSLTPCADSPGFTSV